MADNVPLKSRVGRYQRTWMMVIAPTESDRADQCQCPENNDHKWALLNRDKDGSTRVLAKGVYRRVASPAGGPAYRVRLRRLGGLDKAPLPAKNCHPDRSFSSRTGWEAGAEGPAVSFGLPQSKKALERVALCRVEERDDSR